MKATLQVKRNLQRVLSVCLLTLTIWSCKDKFQSVPSPNPVSDSKAPITSKIKDTDAVRIVSNDVINNNSGLINQIIASVKKVSESPRPCEVPQKLSLSGGSAAGAVPTYSYKIDWNYVMHCSGQVPNQMVLRFKGNTNYDDPELKSNTVDMGLVQVARFTPVKDPLLVYTADTLDSKSTIKTTPAVNVTSRIIASSTNIRVAKGNYAITSGALNFKLTGTAVPGGQFNITGTLTFKGNQTAVIKFNGSDLTYPIKW
jgi:hypothetical protein